MNYNERKDCIMQFLKFMKMDNPIIEIMVDEFLQEVYEYEGDR